MTQAELDQLVVQIGEELLLRLGRPVPKKAEGLKRLLGEFRLTQEQIGARIGMSQSTIAHLLRLLNLPAEVQGLIRQGELSSVMTRFCHLD